MELQFGRLNSSPRRAHLRGTASKLAQHYTWALCEKVRARYPAAEIAFKKMLKKQTPGPYADFVKWTENVNDPGEHMRRCMLEVRKKGIQDYGSFQEILKELTA
jgi:hypothetical protein